MISGRRSARAGRGVAVGSGSKPTNGGAPDQAACSGRRQVKRVLILPSSGRIGAPPVERPAQARQAGRRAMPTARKAGQRGRLPVKPPGERFNIQYVSAYLPAALPAPVYPADLSAGLIDWGMLGNGPAPTLTTHPNAAGDYTSAGHHLYLHA